MVRYSKVFDGTKPPKIKKYAEMVDEEKETEELIKFYESLADYSDYIVRLSKTEEEVDKLYASDLRRGRKQKDRACLEMLKKSNDIASKCAAHQMNLTTPATFTIKGSRLLTR